nr:glycosyltransferase [uncultured Mogibacterium sp.]
MNKEYDVSVIIPIYNSEEYIEQGIQSVLNQSNIEVELILVNDGSTDGSAGIIDEYAKKYDSVKAIHQENAGVGAARNRGIREATGEYIAYLDSDDFYEPEVLPKLIEKCREQELDVLFATFENFFDNEFVAQKWEDIQNEGVMRCGKYPSRPTTGVEILKHFKENKEYNVNVFNQITKREFLIKNGIFFPESIIFEDAPYTFAVLTNAKRTMAMNIVLAKRRIRDNSIEHRPPTVERCYGAFKGIEPIMRSAEKVLPNVSDEEQRKWVIYEVRRRYLFASKAYRELSEEKQSDFLNKCTVEEQLKFIAFIKPHADKYSKCIQLKSKLDAKAEKLSVIKAELYNQKKKLNEMQEIIRRQNKQIELNKTVLINVRKSHTYRVGRIIIGPLSFIKKRLKKIFNR